VNERSSFRANRSIGLVGDLLEMAVKYSDSDMKAAEKLFAGVSELGAAIVAVRQLAVRVRSSAPEAVQERPVDEVDIGSVLQHTANELYSIVHTWVMSGNGGVLDKSQQQQLSDLLLLDAPDVRRRSNEWSPDFHGALHIADESYSVERKVRVFLDAIEMVARFGFGVDHDVLDRLSRLVSRNVFANTAQFPTNADLTRLSGAPSRRSRAIEDMPRREVVDRVIADAASQAASTLDLFLTLCRLLRLATSRPSDGPIAMLRSGKARDGESR
jgi:hypothetical protein